MIVVDLQPSFLRVIHEAEKVVRRSEFLTQIAGLLEVPIIATEQVPERMGGTDERIGRHLPSAGIGKATFSCVGCAGFDARLADVVPKLGELPQVILVGIETHICVTQTALHLLERGFDVKVCEDAVSARAKEMNEIGFRRLRHAGADVAHTESIAYEWMRAANHPKFRDALTVVKEFAG